MQCGPAGALQELLPVLSAQLPALCEQPQALRCAGELLVLLVPAPEVGGLNVWACVACMWGPAWHACN